MPDPDPLEASDDAAANPPVVTRLEPGQSAAGRIRGLAGTTGADGIICYTIELGEARIDLNALLDSGIEIEIDGRAVCVGCGAPLIKRPNHGHCYDCFTKKASMDLCYVAPTRCHYDQGTCREPEWGERVCMQPHAVYLANSGGLKVGLTRHHDGVPRWVEQGAIAGLVVARATTRREAGLLEERIGALVNDKSDWRRQVTGGNPTLDLVAEAARIRTIVELPDGCVWESHAAHEIRYPILRHLRRVVRLKYPDERIVRGRLTGIVGSFLLLDHGAFHIGEHRGYHARLTAIGAVDDLQGELF